MRKRFIPLSSAVVLGGLAILVPAPASAAPITYAYNQTSSTFPTFNVVGSIVIDGGFGDLPILSNTGNPGPYDFGNLLGFSLSMDGRSYALSDFVAQSGFGFPLWNVSPSAIRFVDANDATDFELQFGGINQVSFNADFSISGNCGTTGACKALGSWVSTVPEPFTLALFGAGVVGLGVIRRRNKVGQQISREKIEPHGGGKD